MRIRDSAARVAWALVLTMLAAPPPAAAITLTDLTGRQVHVPEVPQRIVALTPAVLETLFALGAGGAVVGRSTSATVVPG